MSAQKHFIDKWGTGFVNATLHEKNGILQLSMEDIYETMEAYAKQEVENRVNEISDSQINLVSKTTFSKHPMSNAFQVGAHWFKEQLLNKEE
jgi:hypothetical protein